jgi:hypothetical protein
MATSEGGTSNFNNCVARLAGLVARAAMEVDGQYFQPASDPASSTWTIARGYWRENQQMTDGRRVPPWTARTQSSPRRWSDRTGTRFFRSAALIETPRRCIRSTHFRRSLAGPPAGFDRNAEPRAPLQDRRSFWTPRAASRATAPPPWCLTAPQQKMHGGRAIAVAVKWRKYRLAWYCRRA